MALRFSSRSVLSFLCPFSSLALPTEAPVVEQRPLLARGGRSFACRSAPAAVSPQSSAAMTIRFVLMVNKQGQTRLAQYYETWKMEERCALEAEVIRKCLSRTDVQCSFYEFRGYKVVYRRYASLFFIVGVEGDDENELAILEFIHALVETLDRYFENVVRSSWPAQRSVFAAFCDGPRSRKFLHWRRSVARRVRRSASSTSCSTSRRRTSSWTRW